MLASCAAVARPMDQMTHTLASNDSPRAVAEVLALVVAVQPNCAEAQARMLHELDAYRRIGMPQSEFNGLVARFRQAAVAEHGYPHLDDLTLIDELLDSVHEEKHRLLLCRMTSCLITVDGRINDFERTLYDRMLLRWGYTRTSVSRAILAEHMQ
jgi:hypothetical protein